MESSVNSEDADVQQERGSEILLKALQLKSVDEIPKIQEDVAKRVIVILRVTPLAQKNVEELKGAVEQLYEFATSIGGDIARLGEERVVITPPGVRIWRGSLTS
ncbi:MAG: cell division protein SepF [Thaumarchaeota archaeon]|nr:cell division protein SepF [Nitrososphaerota archaeon]